MPLLCLRICWWCFEVHHCCGPLGRCRRRIVGCIIKGLPPIAMDVWWSWSVPCMILSRNSYDIDWALEVNYLLRQQRYSWGALWCLFAWEIVIHQFAEQYTYHNTHWNPVGFQIVLIQTRILIYTRINWDSSFNWICLRVDWNSNFS